MRSKPESIDITTRGEIRAEMARQRISQRELAERLGWKQSSVSRRLNGHVCLSLIETQSIAAALDVPVRQLVLPKSA